MAVQFCCICGRPSNRTWNYVQDSFVACDFHTLNEFQIVASTNPTVGYQEDNVPATIPESPAC